MTGQIPKYGASFRRESVAYEPELDIATRIYVLKADGDWHIRSNRSSEQWFVYWRGQRATKRPHHTMTAAMTACIGACRILSAES